MADKTTNNTTPPAEDNPAPLSTSNQLASSPETESALDTLFKQATTESTPPAPVEDKKVDDKAAEPKAEDATPVEQKTPVAPVDDKKVDEKTAEPKAEDKKSFVDDLLKPTDEKKPTEEKKPVDPFGDIKLRSDASEKTKNTFEQLKAKAREEVEKATKERERIEREFTEYKQKAPEAGKIPEDVEKELKELREFRATFDIERDPEFQQKFDARKNANYDSVYGVLRQFELPESEIEVLKKMSEAERIEAVSGLLDKLPKASRLKIEAKLVENASIDDERAREIANAKSKADTILKERSEAPLKKQEQFYNEVAAAAKQLASTAEFFNTVEIPADTPPAEKARLEKRNAEATRLQQLYLQVLADESPRAKAESAYGLVLAHNFRARLTEAEARVKELEGELTAIKKAGKLGDKGSGGPVKPTPRQPAFNQSTSESLDQLFAEATGANR